MLNIKYFIIFFIFGALLISCKKEPFSAEKQVMQSFEGTWLNLKKNYQETWVSKNGKIYADSFILTKGDTIAHEHIDIIEKGKELLMVITIKNEKIPFKFHTLSNDTITFYSKESPFPKYIKYHLATKNRLEALLQGEIAGRKQEIKFHFEKLP